MKKKNLNFSIIVSNTNRSIAYLEILEKNNFFPRSIIHLNNKASVQKKKYLSFFKNFSNKIAANYKIFKSDTVDNKNVIESILKLNDKYIIYSGYPGKIIKSKKVLKKKCLLHSHSGKLPYFRGSTTIFYSLIINKRIFCSTLILNTLIDSGRVLLVQEYKLPKNIKKINDDYDDEIRAINMIKTLKIIKEKKIENKRIIKKNNSIVDYTVIHPILRSIAIKQI